MTSDEKAQNYKIVDLVESYNFQSKIIFLSSYEKYIFSKATPCHTGEGGMTRLYCHAGASGMTKLTRAIYADRTLMYAPT